MIHLIADSGIQFYVQEDVELNPNEPLKLQRGKMLSYSFCENVSGDDYSFDFLLNVPQHPDKYVTLRDAKNNADIEKLATGFDRLDESGLPVLKEDLSTSFYDVYDPTNDDSAYTISRLADYRINGRPAFDLLLDKWLPMPMFERQTDGITSGEPKGWVRVMISLKESDPKTGNNKYRFVWAIDTSLAKDIVDELNGLKPYFREEDEGEKNFCLCNMAEVLMSYFFTVEKDAFGIEEYTESNISQYLAAILGLSVKPSGHRFEHLAFYVYLISYLRLKKEVAPEIRLYDKKDDEGKDLNPIPVDFVLDIGNSRTCGVLFEDGDFTKAKMLSLRDLSSPGITYDEPFDMRLVFRRADFGNTIVSEDDDLFVWKSFVRVGEEARRLVYRSLENDGTSEKTTSYSSPKRYLWDDDAFQGKWEYLVTTDDSLAQRERRHIYIKGLSEFFDDKGNYLQTPNSMLGDLHYSRSSLMTFVMIEILQQALVQINSCGFRETHGRIDCRRYLRNVILTCPTAMPVKERTRLRKSMQEAFSAISGSVTELPDINVVPSPDTVKKGNEWSYDEASVCQLVYLYAEIVERYSGDVKRFFDMKGHVRPEHVKEGYDKKSLSVCSIDIGAGTTDITICSYKYEEEGGTCTIRPMPLFWDSFYLAGDDILKNIIRSVVIDGSSKGDASMGSIRNALEARLLTMSDEELAAHPSLEPANNFNWKVYRSKMSDILSEIDRAKKESRIRSYASNLLLDYFGFDSNMKSYKDRECRRDFNVQVSLPIAQFMMELLRRHRPSKVYSFSDIFSAGRPSSYLLDHFERHFGFRFEDLEWRFDPKEISDMIKTTMEPLMKQLSIVLYKYGCDVLVLAGRPTSLDCITELFIKYYPLSPDRLIRLNEYMVGSWYPFADGQGYFYDQKSVVAVGAMIGYLASTQGYRGLVLDFSEMISKMKSTANYIGLYDSERQQVEKSLLTPAVSTAEFRSSVFPVYLGCKQFDASIYQARPLYAIYNYSGRQSLRISLSRDYEDKEKLVIIDVTDQNYSSVPRDKVVLRQQSLADEGTYWLDKGEFELAK